MGSGRPNASRNSEPTRCVQISFARPSGGMASNMSAVWVRKLVGKFWPGISKPIVDWSISRISESLERTLRVLQRDHVDILFLHAPVPGLLDADDILVWLDKQRESGKIRYWGLAGEIDQFAAWIRENHQLAQILQVRDGLGETGNQVLTDVGRPFQLTYGYLSAQQGALERKAITAILRRALSRNDTGSVLVSTRHISHLSEIVGVLG